MSIYPRGKKGIYWCEFQHNGQRIRCSTRTTSKRKAQEFERRLRIELQDGGRHKKHTYGEAVVRWLDTEAPKSMYSHIRNTLPYLQDVQLHDVPGKCSEMISAFKNRDLDEQTINRRLSCVKRVLNLAYKEWDWIDRPLAEKIPKLSEKGKERDVFLTQGEFMGLVNAIKCPIARRVSTVAVYTGLRRGELLSLRPDQYRANHVLLDTKTKSGKRRTVPVIAEIEPLMILPFELSEWELRKEFEAARTTVKMEHVRFNDLRHTFASWMIADPDIPLGVLRDLMGHSSLAVTSRYSHLRGSHLTLVEGALGKK